jgi:hypothetical protein
VGESAREREEEKMRRRSTLLAGLWLLWACAAAVAEPKVQVTGSAPRGSIALTIYNPSVTLVQERRTLGLNDGLNEYRVSWGGVNVDRDSVRLEPAAGTRGVTVRDAVYTEDNANSITWHLEAGKAGAYPFSVAYNVSGLSWWADHVLTVGDDERTAALRTWASIANKSGENYQDAEIRLVMGDVRLSPPARAGGGMGGGGGGGKGGGGTVTGATFQTEAEGFAQEGYAEYTFYTLARRESLESGDTKKIELASAEGLALKTLYVYATDMYGPNVAMLYLFDNKKEAGLGALPPGVIRAYRQEADGRLSLLGMDALKYLPVGQTARVYLGNPRNVTVEINQTGYKRTDEEWTKDRERLLSYLEHAEYTVLVKNHKAKSVDMLLRQELPSPDTEVVEAAPKPRSPRVGLLEWDLKIGAGETAKVVYRIERRVYTS